MRLSRKAPTLVCSGLAVALSLGAVATLAGAEPVARVQILGAAKPAEASCPEDCLVEAKVTGFQARIGKQKNPFRVPANGRIVAWSAKLGDPGKEDLSAFKRAFGASRARISVLKPVKVRRKGKPPKIRYRLLRQSPVQALRPFFGSVTTFALPKPLEARKGNIVALTIPTWAPIFSVGQDARWRASRVPTDKRGPCTSKEGQANLDAGAAHDGKRTQRRYGCLYRGARLLYSVRLILGK